MRLCILPCGRPGRNSLPWSPSISYFTTCLSPWWVYIVPVRYSYVLWRFFDRYWVCVRIKLYTPPMHWSKYPSVPRSANVLLDLIGWSLIIYELFCFYYHYIVLLKAFICCLCRQHSQDKTVDEFSTILKVVLISVNFELHVHVHVCRSRLYLA